MIAPSSKSYWDVNWTRRVTAVILSDQLPLLHSCEETILHRYTYLSLKQYYSQLFDFNNASFTNCSSNIFHNCMTSTILPLQTTDNGGFLWSIEQYKSKFSNPETKVVKQINTSLRNNCRPKQFIHTLVLYQRVAQTDKTTTTIKRQFSRKTLLHLPSQLTLFLGLQNNKPHLYAYHHEKC